MAIAKRIPNEPSQTVVINGFDVLCGQRSFTSFSDFLPLNLKELTELEVDTTNWKNYQTKINWWKRPQVLKSISLRPLIEHFYSEDKRHAIMQVASDSKVTISYHVKKKEVDYPRLQKTQKIPS